MLETLYRASENPVLADLIRGLWQRCRPYKIAGARRAAEECDNSQWSCYPPRIVEAARLNDQRAAAALTEESLRSASRRIQTLLAEQRASVSQQDRDRSQMAFRPLPANTPRLVPPREKNGLPG